MLAWFGRHLILTISLIVAVIVFFLLRRSSSSSDSSGAVAYGGVSDAQYSADLAAQTDLSALQYQYGAQAAQYQAAGQALDTQVGGQEYIANLAAQTQQNQDALAAQLGMAQISGQEAITQTVSAAQVAMNSSNNQVSVAQINAQAGVINNQTNAMVQMAEMSNSTQRYAIKKSSSPCFITTCVTKGMKKKDDCAELKTLRYFRDGYMKDNHPLFVMEYDAMAPSIVAWIERQPDRKQIMERIYHCSIRPAVVAVQSSMNERAFQIYRQMVHSCLDAMALEGMKRAA